MSREMIVLLIAVGLSGAVMAKPLPENAERTIPGAQSPVPMLRIYSLTQRLSWFHGKV
jgi:hypothetical protein